MKSSFTRQKRRLAKPRVKIGAYGWYVYGDFCSGRIWAVDTSSESSPPVSLTDSAYLITSFAELPGGELLVVTRNNAIYRLTCAATPDTDGDGQGDACDLDDDNDTWSDIAEGTIGTDPLDNCRDNASDNAWPADINNDGVSDITDIDALAGVFAESVPPAPVRYDIAPDPPDGVVDISDIDRLAGLFGVNCA